MKFTKTSIFMLAMGLMLFAGWGNGYAQLEIRYINSQDILDKYPQWQEVQKQVAELKKQYEQEFEQKQQRGQKLLEEIQNQSLLLSPEKKAEKEAELRNLQLELEKFYYEKLGPQGELYRKNQDLSEPIFEKIQTVIQKIGDEEGYDFIFDSVQGVVLHSKAEYDITEQVLAELNKTQ